MSYCLLRGKDPTLVETNMSGPYVHARFPRPREHGMAVTDIMCHDKGLSQNSPRSHVLLYSTLHEPSALMGDPKSSHLQATYCEIKTAKYIVAGKMTLLESYA